jgi:hypothetical protein
LIEKWYHANIQPKIHILKFQSLLIKYKASVVPVKRYHGSKNRSALIFGCSEFVIINISRHPNKVWLIMKLVDYYGYQLFSNLPLYLPVDGRNAD